MEFSRQEYWSGLPFPSPGDLPDAGIEPWSPELQENALPSEPKKKNPHELARLHLCPSPATSGNSDSEVISIGDSDAPAPCGWLIVTLAQGACQHSEGGLMVGLLC